MIDSTLVLFATVISLPSRTVVAHVSRHGLFIKYPSFLLGLAIVYEKFLEWLIVESVTIIAFVRHSNQSHCEAIKHKVPAKNKITFFNKCALT